MDERKSAIQRANEQAAEHAKVLEEVIAASPQGRELRLATKLAKMAEWVASQSCFRIKGGTEVHYGDPWAFGGAEAYCDMPTVPDRNVDYDAGWPPGCPGCLAAIEKEMTADGEDSRQQ